MALTQVNPALFAGSSNTTTTIQSNGTTAITINSSQAVSIGTTNVGGTLNTTTTSGNWGEIIYDSANNASMLAFRNNAGAAAGNISLSSAGATSLLMSSVAGVNFPATQVASSDANTLDDYEEGTWTPTLAFETPGTSSFSYTTQVGKYTKIGNLVYIDVILIINTFSKGTASGNFKINNAPFQSIVFSGNNDQMFGWGAYNTPLPTGAGVFPVVALSGGSTNIVFQLASNGSTANSPWPDPTAGAQYKVSGCYLTNT